MSHGGKRPGAGRPKGARNKTTREHKERLSQIAAQHSERAIMTLVQVMSDETETGSARTAAANSILDRVLPKLKSVEVDGGVEVTFPGLVQLVAATHAQDSDD